ncbi:MAG: tetratricopeptide repeat protein [Planctomycetota bacterium]
MVDDRSSEGDDTVIDDAAAPAPVDRDVPEEDWSSWSNLWQVPAIVLSIIVIAAGLYVAMQRTPDNDFDGALDQVDRLIETERFDLAAAQLNEVIEPNLDLASPIQQARFEATVADWIALSQAAAGLQLDKNNRRIAERYMKAADLGGQLEPERLERWAAALLAVGDLEVARQRLAELEALAGEPGATLEARRRRNRVLRGLVEVSLGQPDLSLDEMMRLLDGYRADPMLAPADELWAIARQAELRLETGQTREAVAHLLIDMRRFEPQLETTPGLSFGELYVLLARGYSELGNYPYAEYHVEQAMQRIEATDPIRGDALIVLGQIGVTRGQWHEAFEHFDRVLRDFAATRSAIPARLGRAEIYSILGDDERSLADFHKLHAELAAALPRRDVAPQDAARSLADRHDAALTTDRLPAALEYILLAETFFGADKVSQEVVFRIASTSRQLADDLINDARVEQPDAGLEELDPTVRFEAGEHYRRAGDYYVRHARALAGRPGADEVWADSLWLAADCYDLGGWHDLSIAHFAEYVAGRSDLDPRRPEAVFRLAQAYHAELDYESAAQQYEQVLEEHPRSHVASRSHVPLARCLLALGRRPEAERQMIQVVSGRSGMEPEALDYRDALIELGSLYYDNEDFVGAIERLHEAVRRYPGDARINDIRFRLADSYRRRAIGLEPQLGSPGLPPAERRQLESQRTDHLRTAAELFADICGDPSESISAAQRRLSAQLHRYACLYQADCLFELGVYAEAVDRYDEVATRFPRHHTSMTALIQIVNCFSNLGDTLRARAAHRRALLRLEALPDEAFEAPDALLDRAAWERWLKNMPVGQTSTDSPDT